MRILNHKIYNKYYPILTADDSRRFVEENGYDFILHQLECDENALLFEESMLVRNFESQRKPEYGFFGRIKFHNVAYNRALEKQLQEDLDKINVKIDKNNEQLQEFVLNQHISIETANHILESMNHTHRSTWYCAIALIIAIVLFCIIF